MSGRDYFDLRYAIPGFTFILLIVAINYGPLSTKLLPPDNNNTYFTIFFGIVSLLSGSAIGFLISQGWFTFHNWNGGILSIRDLESARNSLITNFELKGVSETISPVIGIPIIGLRVLKEKDRHDNRKLDCLLTYLLHHCESERTNGYIQRRLDIYQTLSCTLSSLALSVVLGLAIRHYYLPNIPLTPPESGIIGLLTIGSAILIVTMWYGRHFPLINYETMLKVSIQQCFIENNKDDEGKKVKEKVISAKNAIFS